MVPLYKSLKTNGTSFYAFPGAAEDISAAYQNQNYKMYFSKYVLLNLPKQNLNPGTNSSPIYFDFENSFNVSPDATPAYTYKDQLVESLRNYIANYEVTIKESRLNNTEYYYDNTDITTPSEKIFWKWCTKLNLIDFEPAVPGDEYFNNLTKFQSNNINDESYFPEILWKEREVRSYNILDYYETAAPGYTNKLEIQFSGSTNIKVGDIINFSGETNTTLTNSTSLSYDNGDPIANINGISTKVLYIIDPTSSEGQKLVVDINTTLSSAAGMYTGSIELVYHKLVQYIGEVQGVNNVQQANNSYTEVYAHIPDHTGVTPDILFRTAIDNNYKPNLTFPILASQTQPEIVGAENFESPIVQNPQNYPGSYYGQFDTEYYNYVTSTGDQLRRSGDYYGISGDINNMIVNSADLDGLILDFDTNDYVKMNVLGKELTNFDQFNALTVNNLPPKDFEFNSIAWFYTVEDNFGNKTSNLYGISILDNPDNNTVDSEVGLRIPLYKKLVATDTQDGTSYAFSLNLNYQILSDNPQDTYNPQAINSLFSFNLFNEAMKRLALTNDSFTQVLSTQNDLEKQISDIKQLLYTQTDINTINYKINSLNELLKLYSTNQLQSSDTIEVVTNTSVSPPLIQLNNKDSLYTSIISINTTDLYNSSGIIPINISVPDKKDFMVNIINNDSTVLALSNDDKLTIVLDKDLSYKQSCDLIITSSDLSTQNKMIDVYIEHTNGNEDDIPVETKLIDTLNLPVYYNSIQQKPNSAKLWDKFNFDIDVNRTIQLNVGGILEIPIDSNSNIVKNSIYPGDSLLLENFQIGTYSNVDFSGQYIVDSVGATNSYLYMDVNNNSELISYGASASLPLVFNDTNNYLLSNYPYLSLNKGSKYRITRVIDDIIPDVNGVYPSINDIYLITKIY